MSKWATDFFSARRVLLVALLLAALTVGLFWPVQNHDFVNFDDQDYVSKNVNVQKGLTRDSVLWALRATDTGNWHPLTWLSYMLDVTLFGLDPGRILLVNVLLHAANTLLLFFLLRRMTGALWRSVIVAAFFAVHPLHVESVAWISERKDVLSAFFWLLTIWTYHGYVKRGGVGRYLAVILVFAIGLTAKPMLVTLPFVLLLLDYWPLGRLLEGGRKIKGSPLLHRMAEKAPLFCLSFVSILVTFQVQQKFMLVKSISEFPVADRVANALVSYVWYAGKMVLPTRLCAFYLFPENISLWKALAAALLMIAITLAVILRARKNPYLVTGWFWYLGTLVPVIGLVQVGLQSRADRYTYLPLIGLFIMLIWAIAELAGEKASLRRALGAGGAAAVLAFALFSSQQISYWQDSVTLFRRVVAVTKNNYVAYTQLGVSYVEKGNYREAVNAYREALRIRPDYFVAYYNLGFAYVGLRDWASALEQYRALRKYNTAMASQLKRFIDLARRSQGG